jgi:NAD-dependent SIR2 family protein deacetylase
LREPLDLLLDRPLVVLTGAGLSTDSGIPDYRGPGSPARMPMTYQKFVSGPAARQRYWARSHLGWGRMRHADPNAGHHALVRLAPELLITQNVDGLHEAAGTRNVCALHGRITEVVCLSCRRTTTRAALHARLEQLNPGWAGAHAHVEVRPDGDVALEETAGFVVPACDCGGTYKPDVVFFGENVPPAKVAHCYDLVGRSRSVLVLGSSLAVMSGLRFVKRAASLGRPVAIVNQGWTRGDEHATWKLHAALGPTLTALVGTV